MATQTEKIDSDNASGLHRLSQGSQQQHSDDNHDKDVIVVNFDGPDDPQMPANFPRWRQIAITGLVLWSTLVVLSSGSLFVPAHEAIAEEFNIDESSFSHTYWPVTTWALGAAIFAMFILPLMEEFGVYYAFLGSWLTMTIFTIPQAVAQNFATIVVTRFFVGGSVAIIANCACSVIVSLWSEKPKICSALIGQWIVCYLVGNSIGPVIGAVIFENLGWRWTFYMQIIYYSIMFPFIAIILQETRAEAILLSKARGMRKQGLRAYTKAELDPTPLVGHILKSAQRPVMMLCTEFVVTTSTIWSAFLFGNIYLFTQSSEQVFITLYGWTATQSGYLLAAVVIGELIGIIGPIANDYFYFRSAKNNPENPGQPLPESRLYTATVGGLLGVTGGMFVYAWTSYSDLPWIGPAVGLAMVGFGVTVVVNAIANYVVDAYANYAASAVAAIALGENVFIAFLPFAAQPMYTRLGFQWASTLLAFVSLALSAFPFVMIRYGKKIRQKSPFMEASVPIHRPTGTAGA